MIDIITTTYPGHTSKLKACIKSVTENTHDAGYRWYIWVNSPNDELKGIIHNSMFIDEIQFNNRIIPIFNDSNDGSFAHNNNGAAKEGFGDYILLLNDDVAPINSDWLANMVYVLETDDKVGVVGALLFYPGQQLIQHCGVFFSRRYNNLPFHMLYRQPIEKFKSYIYRPRYYQAVTGACMLLRRSDFEAIGGLSEAYWYCYEDVDLCLRVKKQLGKQVVYFPQAQLIHNEGISSHKDNNNRREQNIAVFKDSCAGLYYDDYDFYMRDVNFMTYKLRTPKDTEWGR